MKKFLVCLMILLTFVSGRNSMLQPMLFEKIAKGQSLSVPEQMDFVEFMKRLQFTEQAVNKWTSQNPGTAQIDDSHVNRYADGIRVQSVAQSLTSGAITNISFAGGVFEYNDSMWDSANPTRIYIKIPGVYRVEIKSQFVTNAAGNRFTYLSSSDASGLLALSLLHTANPTTNGLNTIYTDVVSWVLAGGTYLEFPLMQNSGGPLNGQVVVTVSREERAR